MSNQLEKIKELIDRRTAARMGGGEKAIPHGDHPNSPKPPRSGLPRGMRL